MAQTQQQIAAAIAAAEYHLEVTLTRLPPAPQRSGWCQFDAVVVSCYRAPGPLAPGTPVRVALPVAAESDPPAPGAQHIVWSALKTGQPIEIAANGDQAELRVVDGGVRLSS